MKIAVRADAALHIGAGHIMRCLTLACECRRQGHEVMFVCRPFPGHLCDLVEEEGFPVSRLSGDREILSEATSSAVPHAHWLGRGWQDDAEETLSVLTRRHWDWVIVDHYALDANWESPMRDRADRIMVIDDLADRRHASDVLLDQNLYPEMNERYSGITPSHSIRLLGPSYALLRPEFSEKRNSVHLRTAPVGRILISFGGTDPHNLTSMALRSIASLNVSEVSVDVVVGKSNVHIPSVKALCDQWPVATLHIQTSEMAELMLNADLSIGGGGGTSWERCALGLPALVVSLAENQKPICESIAATGVAHYLGEYSDITEHRFTQALRDLMSHPTRIRRMSQKCVDLLDAQGCARVVSVLAEYVG